MNLGVFNRVNYNIKDTEGGGMYSEWASLTTLVQHGNEESQSVLAKFPMSAGKDVAMAVVKQLASNLGLTQAAEPSPLTTDKEVMWCMEVICFGMSLPLSEHDTIRDCVSVYCEWLSALLPVPKVCVPKPVCEDPNLYARKMITHFHNLFIPRKGEGADTINRQAVLCHRVLRTLQHLAHQSSRLDRHTWEALLLFLLAINDTLLSPPTIKDDVGDQLCERVLSVLFEVWLLACVRCFPSPPLWKTLRETCMNWRHRVALVEQWNRVNILLTARLLEFMYGPSFPEIKIPEEDAQLIPANASRDCIAQSWFRFLHCLGNPVNLCRPSVVSQTQKFLQFAIISETVVDPSQHPCLSALPLIFLKAIKGIAGLVDAFLGIAQPFLWEEGSCGTGSRDKKEGASSHPPSATHSPTPPPQRRLAKSFSVAPSAVTKGMPKASLIGLTSSRASTVQTPSTPNSGPSSASSLPSVLSLGSDTRNPLAPGRPKCNSILHLFGEWLFEAANIGCEGAFQNRTPATSIDGNTTKRPSSILVDNRKGSFSQPASLADESEPPLPPGGGKYEAGRAEALGALCRIFCAKKTGEEILPVYLARFYLSLQQGLRVPENRECGESLASILLNSSDLFRLDLDGVQVLLPYVTDALEVVLPDKDLKLKSLSVSKTELRRASIHLLLSMLALPLHFQNLPIKELGNTNPERGHVTFAQLKPRLMNLLINALQVESDSQNAQMLLGGLMLSVQDSASAEEVEQVTQPDLGPGSDTTSNLLSSASDTVSSFSLPSDFRSLGEESLEFHHAEGAAPFGNLYLDYPVGLVKNSAHALFVRATYLVCHRLISSWKTDLNVSLAALELLVGLARTHIRETDALECKRAVKWLCDYIMHQCGRPPPAHSKDLHSAIVAAFQCAGVWLVAHPYLLQDKESLTNVLEVVELGISGTKSQGKPGEPIKMKDEKELKPASMRVRDAAEALLTIILEQVGYFPSPCGPESLSSLLDEVSLVKHCNSWPGGELSQEAAIDHFRYFVIENSTVLALLEEPLGNDQDPQPTVTVLIRGPFGRHAWTMQLRHLPRHKSGTKYHTPNPGRPVPMADVGVRHEVRQRYFPDSVDRIPQCKIDRSIPTLDSLSAEEPGLQQLQHLIERQSTLEQSSAEQKQKLEAEQGFCQQQECVPPTPCQEYQTARLFLSHFGFLSLDSANGNMESPTTPITALNPSIPGFCQDLEALDSMSSRTCDTVHVFYVRAGQKTPEEILANVLSPNTVHPHFLEFLLSLGWPVNVYKHPGWTGHLTTSWKICQPQSTDEVHQSKHGGCLYDGQTNVLYWADASSEVAFVVPTRHSDVGSGVPSFDPSGSFSGDPTVSGHGWYERSISESNPRSQRSLDKPRTLSLDLDKQPSPGEGSRRRTGATRNLPTHSNTKVLVVWIESFEDHLNFPLSELLSTTYTGLESSRPQERDTFIIFLQSLASGLLRVHLQGPIGRTSLATPLVDGMVVSRRVLGSLVRQTALNMCRRRRLDNDSYQPPHVRRRLKVQEMVQKYRCEMTQPELLTYLFTSPPS